MNENFPKPLEELIKQFSQLPGIGKKTAARLAIYITKMNRNNASDFSAAIENVQNEFRFCKNCFNISENDECNICTNFKRDTSTICVVEDFTDIFSIEKTGEYHGLYHVLGGLISPLEGKNPDDLTMSSLFERLNSGVKELIMAINPNSEGEVTMLYISKILKNHDIKITYLARGIPMGTNLEYLDEATLGKALEGRREI